MTAQRNLSRRAAIRSLVGTSLLMPGLLSELLAADQPSGGNPLAPRSPHYAPRAKRLIVIFATGGVSHIDTFDPKTSADGRDGSGKEKLMGNLFGAQRDPVTGIEVSNLFPHVRGVMSEIALSRSMKSAHFDHSEATLGMHTGSATFARPSLGSWVSYGLGTANQNLPSFMVIAPHLPYGGTQVYNNDFLPAYHQGMRLVPGDDPVPNLARRYKGADLQTAELDLLGQLNRRHLLARDQDPTLASRIRAFQTAFHMQTEAPEALDIDQESDATLELYGLKRGQRTGFGWQALVARRLAERGVRCIELIDTGSNNKNAGNWDSHGDMMEHKVLAQQVDQPIAALIQDLKQRGMLDETLIVWATEFGRTPTKESKLGRGHHGDCFSSFLAGGGVKGGTVLGATDDIGKTIAEHPVEVHDLHATILHLMGIDHERLTYKHAGRDFRLTDVFGHLLNPILA